MIKKSLTRKLIFIFSAILITVVTLNIAFNALLLSRVYRNKKVDAMENLYYSLSEEYLHAPDNDSIIEIVKNTLTNENLRVFIWDKDNRLIIDSLPLSYEEERDNPEWEYQPRNPSGQREDRFADARRPEFRFGRMELFLLFTEVDKDDILLQNTDYTIFSFKSFDNYDDKTLCLRSVLSGEYKLLIQMPYAPIGEAISITNMLLLSVGSIMLIIGIIVVAVTSRNIAKPVKELSQIASAMESLDFSRKYMVSGNDEIASLGESINSLSSKLENTINELRQKNEELLSDIELKSKIDTLRKEFIANASHELKTPLALISGYAEGLRDNIAGNEETRALYADVIIEEAQTMDKIIRQMLDLMELDGADKPLEVRSAPLSEAVKEVLSVFDLIFKNNEINVSCTFDKDCTVKGDFIRIRQAISNYFSNAVNHIDKNKILYVSVTKENDNVIFSVYNSGMNIPKGDTENIWERFYKVDKAHTREYGGSGLGLSIVRSIVELHGGTYGFKNLPEGVEFYFSLPYDKENVNEN